MDHDVGDIIRLQATFKDSTGALVDPTTVVLKVKTPALVTSTYTYALAQVTRASLGVYYKDVTPDAAGVWRFRWYATGTPTLSREDYFNVLAANVV